MKVSEYVLLVLYKYLYVHMLPPRLQLYKLCIDSFPHLFKIYQEKGHVDDEVFEQLEFPMDRDVDGTNVSLIRALTITILYNIHNTLDDILERIR